MRPTRMSLEQLQKDDVVVIYSDGVTEALDIHGQEYSEERLIALVQHHHTSDAAAILDASCRTSKPLPAAPPSTMM